MRLQLLLFHNLRRDPELTAGAAVRKTAKYLGVSETSVRAHLASFESSGEITFKDGKKRGRVRRKALPLETHTRIERFIEETHNGGFRVHIKDICEMLRTRPDSSATDGGRGEEGRGSAGRGSSGEARQSGEFDEAGGGVEVSPATVRDWIKRMGYSYRWGKVDREVTGYREARLCEFLIHLSDAISKTNDPALKYKLVYMDEACVRVNHGPENNASSQGGGGGKTRGGVVTSRIIAVHAICEEGPLVTLDGDGFPIEEGWFKDLREKELAEDRPKAKGQRHSTGASREGSRCGGRGRGTGHSLSSGGCQEGGNGERGAWGRDDNGNSSGGGGTNTPGEHGDGKPRTAGARSSDAGRSCGMLSGSKTGGPGSAAGVVSDEEAHERQCTR